MLAVNEAPVAVADSYSTDEDTPLSVVAPGVLGNDTDPDGDALAAGLVSGPVHGALILNADGSFSYSPDGDYAGPDGFSYEACDPSLLCDTAVVTVEVLAVNDPPVAVDDSASTPEDTPVLIDAAANDTDVDGNLDPTSAAVTSSPADGAVINHGDGSFTYTPDGGFQGSDSFVYQICDTDGACDTATVSIDVLAVNEAPVAVADSYSTDEDTPLSVAAPGVLGNDTDPDGDALAAGLVSGPVHGLSLIHISEPTRPTATSRMPSSA